MILITYQSSLSALFQSSVTRPSKKSIASSSRNRGYYAGVAQVISYGRAMMVVSFYILESPIFERCSRTDKFPTLEPLTI